MRSARETHPLLVVLCTPAEPIHNLRDAGLAALSADNRFGLAYEAALLAAKLAVNAASYRVKALPGAHRTTFAVPSRHLDDRMIRLSRRPGPVERFAPG